MYGEALRLAKLHEFGLSSLSLQTCYELRRLHEAREELVATLQQAVGLNSFREFNDFIPVMKEVISKNTEAPRMTKIVAVAIQYDGKVYSLPKPNRHHHVIRAIAAENGEGIHGPDVQGFLDEAGKFLNRREAYILATNTCQINRRPGGYNGTDLYSEDLW